MQVIQSFSPAPRRENDASCSMWPSKIMPARGPGEGVGGRFFSPPKEGDALRLFVRVAFASGSHPKGAAKNLTLVRMRMK
jgi:hypothetical protein